MADYNGTIDITEQLKYKQEIEKQNTPVEANTPAAEAENNEEKKIIPEPAKEPEPEPLKLQIKLDPQPTDLSLSSSLTLSMKQFLSDQDDMIWCPVPGCRFVFENSGPGEEQIKTFDQEMSEEAKKHYHNCRFRCRKCAETFCSQCKAYPYHFGFTCAELKAKNEAVLCRFCDEELPNVTMSEHLKAIEENAERLDHCTPCANDILHRLSSFKFPCKHANYYTEDYFSQEKCECLHEDCRENVHDTNLEDFCGICGIEPLKRYHVMKLSCSHIFHSECIEHRMSERWKTNNISFAYSKCPLCNKPVELVNGGYMSALVAVEALKTDLAIRIADQLAALKIDIGKKLEDEDFVDEGLRKFNYYECYSCQSLYYGGQHECGEQIEVPAEELKCSGCRGCKAHGDEHLLFKCRYCCSLATWFCFGHTHFCTPCHDNFTNWVETNQYQYITEAVPQCPGPDKCPLGCAHPPNGEEHCLGCSACKDVIDFTLPSSPPPVRVQEPRQPLNFNVPDPAVIARENDVVARREVQVQRNRGGNVHANRFLPKVEEVPARPVFQPRRAGGNNVGKLLAMFQQQQ